MRALAGSGRWKKIADLFDQAVDLPDQEQDAFLESACAGDAPLLAELRALLAAHRRTGVLDRLQDRVMSDVDAALPAVAEPGAHIGTYRVIERIGSGGMGVVYLAAREGEGFQQRVAIKVLHHALLGDTRGIVPRFLAERSILSLLEHPNIPRFLDGGLTRDGVPYFAMEYVEGTPIDRYCDEHTLSVRQRLSLFVSVCDAMQYAHQHLVVHRDLKPSNIVVTSAGVPKVLDFGIAKILNLPEGETGILTDAGQRWMTPNYASPEQVRGDAVTTAADVFALGVLMYELVACRRPHAGKSRHEVERAILETEPLRPSESLPSGLCEKRGESPARLRRELEGDVDTIAMKALSKAPERRYRTAGELADDIRRYLAGFPVLARADTFAYRTGKFVTRHRRLVIALGVAAVSLIAGTTATAIAWRRASRHAADARLERDRAEQVSRFAVELFASADPLRAGAIRDVSAGALLDRGAARLRRELADQPDLKAGMLQVLAQSYSGLGRFEDAHAAIAQAVLLRRGEGRPSRELASALELQASVFINRQAPDSAVIAAREALGIRRALQHRGADMARALDLLGTYFHMTGSVDSAEHYLRAAMSEYEDPSDSARAERLSTLGMIAARRGNWAAAESLQLSAYELLRAANPNGSHMVASALSGAAFAQVRQGRIKQARQTTRDAATLYERTLGPKHFDVVNSMAVMANLAAMDNDLDSAAYWATRSLALKRETLGENHPSVWRSLLQLGAIRRRQGDLRSADSLIARGLAARRSSLGDRHPDVADGQLEQAALRIAQGRLAEAQTLIDGARRALLEGKAAGARIVRADSLLRVLRSKSGG